LINLDFADVRTIMGEMGMAMMGAGSASGENRAAEAAQKAISSPLLEDISIHGAKGVLINITGSHDLSLHEVNEAATLVQEEAHEDANIIFGAVIDERMGDELRITVIATGFDHSQRDARRPGFTLPRDREPVLPGQRVTPTRVAARDRTDGRPVVHMGTIVDEADGPVWHRPKVERVAEPDGERPEQGDRFTLTDEADEQYEIPAFLRKNVG
jgi:cell division GTPase FtsZ